MIDTIFKYLDEYIMIRVEGNNVSFMKKFSEASVESASIDGLKLSKQGVIKEFPDLENNDDWREIAIALYFYFA